MKYLGLAVTALALLTACGGGGGGGGGTSPVPVTPTATPTPALSTNASGTLVDDTTGTALSGVHVVLYPWTSGSTTVVAQTTTDSSGKFTLSNVANGHYLLVIGSNSPSDTTYTTVHDNVTLTGGNQTLKAPTLPSMPGYAAPAWETNGTYRISTINATSELPCFTRFNIDRVNAGQAQVPADEWTMENVRTNNANTISPQFTTASYLSSQNGFGGGGTFDCNAMVDYQFNAGTKYAADPRVAWYGAAMIVSPTNTYVGTIEAPFDPRGYTDPSYPTWP